MKIAPLAFLLASFAFHPVLAGEEAFVRVAPFGQGFEAGGKPWRPFGANYFDPHVGWAPKLWQKFDPERVESHFQAMEDLGVNVVRVFLTAQSFFPDPPALDPGGLAKFEKLLDIARRHGIKVHPAGPDHWEGTPAWRRTDIFADEKALEAQVAFWKAFAARYREERTIFAYDLLNEPQIGWSGPALEGAWRAHLRGKYASLEALRKEWGAAAEGLESFEAVRVPPDEGDGSPRLLDFQRFRETLADRWVKLQAEAIRASDPNHLVTVGLIQWSIPVLHGIPSRYAAFRPSRIAPFLDFLSVHFYPLHGDPIASEEGFRQNLAYLELVLRYVRAGDPRKPLLVGEFGWYGGGAPDGQVARSGEDQARWCRAAVLQGKGIAAGWLNWAFADTPTSRDMSKFSGLFTEKGERKPWGDTFRELARDPAAWSPDAGDPGPLPPEAFEIDRAVTSPKAGDAMLQAYFQAWKPAARRGLLVR